jgi:hypothetical protein
VKIRILPVAPEFQPPSQEFRYPGHNDHWDVEQDFLRYVQERPELLAGNDSEADWSYLPIFWTRWHMAHDYARTGRWQLQAEVARVLTDAKRSFTVCLYEDGPLVDIGTTVLLTATRKRAQDIDIPTLCAQHQTVPVRKFYRANFVGRLHTNPVRQEMVSRLAGRADVLIANGDVGEDLFVRSMLSSYLALCPSGGSGSFRFYEAMQLSVAPLLIHDLDTRPFKRSIDWDSCSMYLSSAQGVEEAVDRYDVDTLQEMGRRAGEVYHEHLAYQKWCGHALQELACVSV